MQASGQYGIPEMSQYVNVGRAAGATPHFFALSHDMQQHHQHHPSQQQQQQQGIVAVVPNSSGNTPTTSNTTATTSISTAATSLYNQSPPIAKTPALNHSPFSQHPYLIPPPQPQQQQQHMNLHHLQQHLHHTNNNNNNNNTNTNTNISTSGSSGNANSRPGGANHSTGNVSHRPSTLLSHPLSPLPLNMAVPAIASTQTSVVDPSLDHQHTAPLPPPPPPHPPRENVVNAATGNDHDNNNNNNNNDSRRSQSSQDELPDPSLILPSVATAAHEKSSLSGDEQDDLGDKGGGAGNRWPRDETLALLKIRSEMDSTFRDSSLKGPLWEDVSRKLAELGFHRSSKKCKEKFENLHKYYKRTKEGKAGRQDGKSYRFFSQLEALYGGATTPISINNNKVILNHHTSSPLQFGNSPFLHLPRSTPTDFPDNAIASTATPMQDTTSSINAAVRPGGSLAVNAEAEAGGGVLNQARMSGLAMEKFDSDHTQSNSSLVYSSSSSSDEEEEEEEEERDSKGRMRARMGVRMIERKRKRKSSSLSSSNKRFMSMFQSVVKKVVQKQEQMQQRFLECLERREEERMIREEAWRRQEVARLNREQELRSQERTMAASRDAALVAFLHKVTGQTLQLPQIALPAQPMSIAPIPPHHLLNLESRQEPQPDHSIPSLPSQNKEIVVHSSSMLITSNNNNNNNSSSTTSSSKRWPKPEVLELIKLRTSMNSRFQEAGPKGPLWEEISRSMARLGFNRNAKRCKEKWENINKYFKKARESNKKRPENSKTCPYYHHLDALYKNGFLGPTTSSTMPLTTTTTTTMKMLTAPIDPTTRDEDMDPELSSEEEEESNSDQPSESEEAAPPPAKDKPTLNPLILSQNEQQTLAEITSTTTTATSNTTNAMQRQLPPIIDISLGSMNALDSETHQRKEIESIIDHPRKPSIMPTEYQQQQQLQQQQCGNNTANNNSINIDKNCSRNLEGGDADQQRKNGRGGAVSDAVSNSFMSLVQRFNAGDTK